MVLGPFAETKGPRCARAKPCPTGIALCKGGRWGSNVHRSRNACPACPERSRRKPVEGLEEKEYHHQAVNHSANEYVKGMVHANGIESVWAALKRSLFGTHHHVSIKHLPRYLNEVTSRLNEGCVQNILMDRIEALCRLSLNGRLPYATLTK